MNSTTKLTLGFSPCPNDCFIFDALVHGKIDTGDLEFDVVMEDVETLNKMALKGQLDITKLSYHAYAYCLKEYILLKSGSALGFNCGPLLISKEPVRNNTFQINTVAIPGKYTTANFLLSLAFPQLSNKVEYLFSDIENAVLNGEVDAGLIIHENRFTYEDKGLHKIMDLGEFWDDLIKAPIPLGGICMLRKHSQQRLHQVNNLIKASVQFAFDNPESSMTYVKQHAQEMSETVMKKHIQLYVNQFSIDLGETGTKAVTLLFKKAVETGLIKRPELPIIMD
ncbi:MAG: 1,4-dihydroxy-6-naphthoate synthase [Sediminibacterium sp.]|nr:1,4-dihydroxy-6-naphthoate synthase [Sediminibacterium sp.]